MTNYDTINNWIADNAAGATPVALASYTNVDDRPTQDSTHLITSGGVYEAIQNTFGEKIHAGYADTANAPLYIFQLDPTEDDPALCITYPPYATNANFTPATVHGLNSWEDSVIGEIKPCVVQNGVVNYWLDPTNIFKKADGVTDAVLTGPDGDVCSAIPTLYWKTSWVVRRWITTAQADRVMEVAMSPHQFRGSEAWAHRFDNEIMPYLFVGCFEGLVDADVLRSVYSSTATPTTGNTNDEFQLLAAAGGTGYSIETYNTWTLLGLIEMMIYKTTDIQRVLGGRTNAASAVEIGDSYRHSAGGPNHGFTADRTVAMRSLYVENRYGNVWKFLSGIFSDASSVTWLNTKNTRFITENTASQEIPSTDHVAVSGFTTTGGWCKKFCGIDPAPLLPAEVGGSSSTYVPDYYSYAFGAAIRYVGGYWSFGAICGPFCVYSSSGSVTDISYGARLQILGRASA